jgi:uncharacterized membrane protein
MSDLLAITFDTADQGEAALKSIRALEHEGKVRLEDTAVITKDASGVVAIHNEASSGTETGAVVGAVLGGILFVVFPVAGLIGGAVAGGLIGRSVAPGIDGKFEKEVADDLPAGGSALFLLIRDGDIGLIVASMRQYRGRVRQTSLDDEQEQALADALK